MAESVKRQCQITDGRQVVVYVRDDGTVEVRIGTRPGTRDVGKGNEGRIDKRRSEDATPNQGTSYESEYRIAKGRKSDFLKILSAAYDLRMFMTADGRVASNKQELITAVGRVFGTELKNYSSMLSNAKQKANFMEVFEQLLEKGRRYYNER